jgi:hypothetical protein
MTRERRTPPSTQALDKAVLALVVRYDHLTLQPLVSMLSYRWCDVSREQVQESLNRLVVLGALTPHLQQVGEQA